MSSVLRMDLFKISMLRVGTMQRKVDEHDQPAGRLYCFKKCTMGKLYLYDRT